MDSGNIASCEIFGNVAKEGGGLYILGARSNLEDRKVGNLVWN